MNTLQKIQLDPETSKVEIASLQANSGKIVILFHEPIPSNNFETKRIMKYSNADQQFLDYDTTQIDRNNVSVD